MFCCDSISDIWSSSLLDAVAIFDSNLSGSVAPLIVLVDMDRMNYRIKKVTKLLLPPLNKFRSRFIQSKTAATRLQPIERALKTDIVAILAVCQQILF